MADPLTLDDVDRTAALAHLALTAEERTRFLGQLNDVLEYARQIQAVDTTGVPPTAHVWARQPADRADEPHASLSVADALAGAPDADVRTGLFKVPRVIGPIGSADPS